MRKRWTVLAAAALALATCGTASAVTFVNPDGTPTGGKWQRWIDQAHAPTYAGTEVFTDSLSNDCNLSVSSTITVTGCTTMVPTDQVVPALQGDYEEALNGAVASKLSVPYQRWLLFYEQGHAVDFGTLTDLQRGVLLHVWNEPAVPAGEPTSTYWWAGEASGEGQVFGEWFAEAYALCALYPSWNLAAAERAAREYQWNLYTGGYPGWGTTLTALEVQNATCDFIRAL